MTRASPHLWRAVAVNGGWIVFDKIVRQGLSVLIGAWIARHLGPAQYGELAYVIAYLSFFQVASLLGADAILVRDLARDAAGSAETLGVAFRLRFLAGIAAWAFAILGMIALHGAGDRSVLLTALAGGILVFQPADVVDLWFQSQSQSRRSFTGRFAAYGISSALKVGLILSGAPLWSFALVVAVEAMLCATGLYFAYRRLPVAGRWTWSRGRARTLLHESWPFMLGGLAVMTYMRIDQLMLETILGKAQLGIYAALLPLSQIAHFVPMSLVAAIAPMAAQRKQQGRVPYEELLLQMFRLFGALGLGTWLCIAAVSPWLVPLLYGPAYAPAVPILILHAASNFFVFQGVAQSLWITNEGAGRIAMVKAVLGAVTSVVANLLLLPRLGLVGAALSAVAASGISAVLSNFWIAPRIAMMQFGLRPPPPAAERPPAS